MSTPVSALEFTNFAEAYERLLVPTIFQPWAEVLLERIAPRRGEKLLDVACGTGIVARLARERVGDEGAVVGIDASPGMLAVARSVEPAIDWREGSASSLPLRDGEVFDVVTCHQGFQFFPDKPLAAAEMRRALRPGGRVAVATWRSVEEEPILVQLQGVAERHLGPIVDARHSFADDAALGAVLQDAGFADVAVEPTGLVIRFANPEVFIRMNASALVGMSPHSKEMSPSERDSVISRIAAKSLPLVEPHLDGGELALGLRSNIATARA